MAKTPQLVPEMLKAACGGGAECECRPRGKRRIARPRRCIRERLRACCGARESLPIPRQSIVSWRTPRIVRTLYLDIGGLNGVERGQITPGACRQR